MVQPVILRPEGRRKACPPSDRLYSTQQIRQSTNSSLPFYARDHRGDPTRRKAVLQTGCDPSILSTRPGRNRVHRLEIIQIKAHVGHPGNERADQLTRNAAQIENIHTEILTPYSHFKKQLLDTTYALWKDEWSTQQTCRLSKNFLPYPSKHKSKEILSLSRSQMRRLIEIITGQNNLNYVQSKIYPGQMQ